MSLPVVVSFYTMRTPYEAMVKRLLASCEVLGLEIFTLGIKQTGGSWESNTAAKARICRTEWWRLNRPILWVDADAVIHSIPELVRNCKADIAVHKWKDKVISTGTIFFNQTPIVGKFLDGWVSLCEKDHSVSDQVHFATQWEEMAELNTLWLPRSYCQIFDSPRYEPAVIEHFQASRTQKPLMETTV